MSCLDSLIGDDYGCTSTTGKRLYLWDSGITEEFLNGLVTKRQATVADFMAERRRVATERVITDVVSHIRKDIIPRTFVDSARIGQWPDTEVLDSADAGYVNGIFLEVCTPASNTKINISSLQFWGETSGTVTASIYNLLDGSLITTLTATAVAGSVTTFDAVDVVVSNPRGTLRLFITTDQDTFYRATINGNCGTCAKGTWKTGPLTAQAVRFLDTDRKTYANRTGSPNTGGLSVVASVSCDHEAFLCEMKPAMALPLMYSLAHEVMDIALNNYDRWGVKDYRREDIKDRRDQLAALYSDAMAKLLGYITTPHDPICFVCDKKTYVARFIPSL